MLSKLKNKFYFLEKLWKQTNDKQELIFKNSDDQLAMMQLLKMFPEEMFFPITKWSLSSKEILHICNDIIINKRTSIVELGGGFSTICIAKLIKINKIETQFFCVENNEIWAKQLQTYLDQNELSQYVKIIVAPLSEAPKSILKEPQKIWYDTSVLDKAFSDVSHIDLLIVDGPYGKSTPFARFSAVPYFKNKLASQFSIFLDDTYREEELAIVKDWEKILSVSAKDYKRYKVLGDKENFDVSPYSNF